MSENRSSSSDATHHTLPMELIHKVLLFLASVETPIPTLLLVCRTAQAWMLPLLYHSIKFTKSTQLSKFLVDHDIPNDLMESRFSLIQNLYIGETPSEAGDLAYGSTNWPLTILTRLLWLCISLKRLVILNLDQNKWHTVEHAVPSSIEYLTLGPSHGPFLPQNLKKRPLLKHFTSISTHMRDDEVQDIVCYPSMQTLVRISEGSSRAASLAAEQARCVSKSQTLERLDIVVCGWSLGTELAVVAARQMLNEVIDDSRISILMDRRAWTSVVYDQYEDWRLAYITSLII
ncbi:hypothetical protein GALMADRAFT_265460 [Galerina marginata CBS 339.88]|uniref:F-box domain-containing protein n=1 Tax=Galerina marginata (strain CBS 339.88) TaxID=685588 RepID=A0A067TAP8_GALM3|nr:hypothetical protein GALMADRAFT_265460 [Galerina marginata CBS 339.88]